jgi:hypothetical protein
MDKITAEKIINYATRAPSGHNSQPWRFVIKSDSIEIYPDFTRALPVVDPENRELYISLGAATENLILAAKDFGFLCDTHLFPGNKDYIQVNIQTGGKIGNTWHGLIDKRQSNRSKYSGQPLTANDIAKLKTVVTEKGVYSTFITESSDIDSIIVLVREGNIHQMGNPAFKKELLSWIRFNKRETQSKRDGLSNAVMGNPPLPFRWLGELIAGSVLTPENQNKRDDLLLKSASGFIIFSVDEDTKVAWINLGRYFERIALEATRLDITISHYNQPFEVPELAEKLKTKINIAGKYPCLMIRFGQAKPTPYSIRRLIDSVAKFN